MDPILTARLLLRAFVPADFDALRALDADPEVLRYRSRAVITPDDTRAFLAQAQAAAAEAPPRSQYPFAVVLRLPDERLVGQCGLTVLPPGRDAFLWYALCRDYWGQGYTSEAARAVLDYGFERAGLQRIFAECHPDNLASARVMQKIGLRPETHTPEEDARYPERREFFRYGLHAVDWRAARARP
ncbi:MAG: GNAT family N-acetyltransferase [Anaerolineales bacterium]|nr:GNAT family N-acetyltransferase [Anaerolineales bacterium]